jgi:hypothetical protein
MLEALGLYFFARAWHDPTRRSLGGWAIASGLALLTHYFAVFFVVPEALLLLVSSAPRRRRAIAIAIAAVVAVGLAVLPLAVVQEGTGRGNDFTQYPVAQRAETALVKYASAEGAAPEGGILSTTPAQRQIGLVGAGLLAVAVAVVAIRGSPTERRSGAGVGAIAMAAFGVPVVLAWLGFDFVDPRNLIGALVPALVALGIAFSPRPSAGVGTAGVLAASALFVYAFHVEATTPAMQRHDWRAAAAALSSRPKAELFVVPQDGRTPLQYYTGRRLEKFIPKHFADGVATRRIVVMTDFQPVRTPQPGFRLVKGQWAPQHWTVDVFASRHPVVVTPKRLADRSVIPQPSTVLIDGKRTLLAAEAADDRRVARARGARRG